MDFKTFSALHTAVVGVIAPLGKGVSGSCVNCRKADLEPHACSGFGPGCTTHAAAKPETPPRKA
jgi:hypothetical protein